MTRPRAGLGRVMTVTARYLAFAGAAVPWPGRKCRCPPEARRGCPAGKLKAGPGPCRGGRRIVGAAARPAAPWGQSQSPPRGAEPRAKQALASGRGRPGGPCSSGAPQRPGRTTMATHGGSWQGPPRLGPAQRGFVESPRPYVQSRFCPSRCCCQLLRVPPPPHYASTTRATITVMSSIFPPVNRSFACIEPHLPGRRMKQSLKPARQRHSLCGAPPWMACAARECRRRRTSAARKANGDGCVVDAAST